MNTTMKPLVALSLVTGALWGSSAVRATDSGVEAPAAPAGVERPMPSAEWLVFMSQWVLGRGVFLPAFAFAPEPETACSKSPAGALFDAESAEYLNCAGASGLAVDGSGGEDDSVIAGISLTNGAISRNIYRIPYAGVSMSVTSAGDYFDHGGSMDIRNGSRVCTGNIGISCTSSAVCAAAGLGSCEYVMVAPAPGRVCTVLEHLDDCGSGGGYGAFGNVVVILHANGEASRYLHVKQWSPNLFGVDVGDFVNAGQPIAIDGDVGRSQGGTALVCGPDGPPRFGTCLTSVASGSGNCFRHSHWNVIRYRTGEVLNPFTCGIAANRYQSGQTYAPVACGTTPLNYANSGVFAGFNYDGLGSTGIAQRISSIVASTVTVQNQGSLVYHAGNSVRLTPGFAARAGSYFRAEAGTVPDLTAPGNGPGVPSSCPCSDAQGFCVQWSDLTHPDRVRQGCATPGPTFDSCHGCTIGGRCCPCQTAGNCETSGSCN